MKIKEFIEKEYKPLGLIIVLFLVHVLLFKYKTINLYTDFGKEVFYSQAVSFGEVLYKDIFAMFGPFSYMLNGFWVKILGADIRTFYAIGCINTLSILICFYFLCKNFLSTKLSLASTIFVLCGCCFSTEFMNFVTPYSYAMVFGLNACLVSMLLFINYLKNDNKSLLFFSFLFAGIAVSNKYEFFLYFIVLAFCSVFHRVSLKNAVISSLSFLSVPVFLFSVLFFQGLTVGGFLNYLETIFSFSTSPELAKFYDGTFYFSLHYFSMLLISFLIFVVIFAALFFAIKFIEKKKTITKTLSYALLIILLTGCSFFFMSYFVNFIFCWLSVVLTVLMVVKVKELKANKALLFLCLSAVVLSAKSYFFLAMNLYGRYFLPLLLFSIIACVPNLYFKKEESKQISEKTIILLLMVLSVFNFSSGLESLSNKVYKIETKAGTVYAGEKDSKIFNYLISYINESTSESDKIIVLPESPMLNFLTQRKSDNYYNYFVPALLKTFKEETVISHYEAQKPDYFFIFTSPYDDTALCNGYGYALCGWIKQNYHIVKTIQADSVIFIFKKI